MAPPSRPVLLPAGLALLLAVQLLAGLAGAPVRAAAGPSASPGFGLAGSPAFDTFGIHHAAYEPSIGFDRQTGKAMYVAEAAGTGAYSVWRLGFTDTPSGATLQASDTGAAINNVDGLGDPILYTDSVTGRTWAGDIQGTCTSAQYTDDDGATWTSAAPLCSYTGADHETFGSGPWAADPVTGSIPAYSTYSRALYTCAQTTTMQCSLSYDGGDTFVPTSPVDVQRECGGLHGHLRIANDGTVFLPNRLCNVVNVGAVSFTALLGGAEVGMAVTQDNGQSWTIQHVPGSHGTGSFDPSVGPTTGSWAYIGQTEDAGAYVALTKDAGATFEDVGTGSGAASGTKWFNVASLDPAIKDTDFAEVIAGDNERAAFSFLGANALQTDQANCGDTGMQWYLYIAYTYDAGKSWSLQKVTDEPINQGDIQSGGTTADQTCRNLADFNDITVDPDGRVLLSYTDGCRSSVGAPNACSGDSSPPYGGLAAVARQATGKGLYAAKDSIGGGTGGGLGSPLLTLSSPAPSATVAPGSLTVAGSVDRVGGSGGGGGTNQAPTASLSAPTLTGPAPLAVTFSPSATDSDGSIADWSLDFGDGGPAAAGTGAPPSTQAHTYTAPGTYAAVLSVHDDKGAPASSAPVAVSVTAPSGGGPKCVDDSATDAGGLPDYDITKLCGHVVGTDLVLELHLAGMVVGDAAQGMDSPVGWDFYIDDHGPYEVYFFLGQIGVFSYGDPTTAVADYDTAAGAVILTIPLADIGGAGTHHVWAATYAGESGAAGANFFYGAPVVQDINKVDTVPDTGTVAFSFMLPTPLAAGPLVHPATPQTLFLKRSVAPVGVADLALGVAAGATGAPLGEGPTMSTDAPTLAAPSISITTPAASGANSETLFDANWNYHGPVDLSGAEVKVTLYGGDVGTNDPVGLACSETWDVRLFIGTGTLSTPVASQSVSAPFGTTKVDFTFTDVTGSGDKMGLAVHGHFADCDSEVFVLYDGTMQPSALTVREPSTGTAPLVAAAGGPYAGSVGQAIPIAASVAGGVPPYACAWSGAGATFADANSCSTTVTYAATGTPAVTVTATDSSSPVQVATDIATVTVSAATGERVEVHLDGDASPAAIVPVTTGGSHPGQAGWSAQVTVTSAGAHTVSAAWVDLDGTILSQATQSFTVAAGGGGGQGGGSGPPPPPNQAPTLAVSVDHATGSAPLQATFSLTADDPEHALASWAADFDGDGTTDASGYGAPPATLTHTYGAGDHTAIFRVIDARGAVAIATVPLKVQPASDASSGSSSTGSGSSGSSSGSDSGAASHAAPATVARVPATCVSACAQDAAAPTLAEVEAASHQVATTVERVASGVRVSWSLPTTPFAVAGVQVWRTGAGTQLVADVPAGSLPFQHAEVVDAAAAAAPASGYFVTLYADQGVGHYTDGSGFNAHVTPLSQQATKAAPAPVGALLLVGLLALAATRRRSSQTL